MFPPSLQALLDVGNLSGAAAVVISALNDELAVRGGGISVETLMKIGHICDRSSKSSVLVLSLP